MIEKNFDNPEEIKVVIDGVKSLQLRCN